MVGQIEHCIKEKNFSQRYFSRSIQNRHKPANILQTYLIMYGHFVDPRLNKYAGGNRFYLQSMPDAGRSIGHTRPVSVNEQFSELLNSSIARST